MDAGGVVRGQKQDKVGGKSSLSLGQIICQWGPKTSRFWVQPHAFSKTCNLRHKSWWFLSRCMGGDVSSCMPIPQADPKNNAFAAERSFACSKQTYCVAVPTQTQPSKVCGDSGNSVIGMKVVARVRNNIFQEGRSRFYCGLYAWLRMRHDMLLQGGRGGDLAGGWVYASFADLRLFKAVSEWRTLKPEVLIGVNDF